VGESVNEKLEQSFMGMLEKINSIDFDGTLSKSEASSTEHKKKK